MSQVATCLFIISLISAGLTIWIYADDRLDARAARHRSQAHRIRVVRQGRTRPDPGVLWDLAAAIHATEHHCAQWFDLCPRRDHFLGRAAAILREKAQRVDTETT